MNNQPKNKKTRLEKMIIVLIYVLPISFFLILYIIITPMGDFQAIQSDMSSKIKIFTHDDYKQLLMYRRKSKWNSTDSITSTCYVRFIQFHHSQLDASKLATNGFLSAKGYRIIDKSNCVAQTNNDLSKSTISFAAPFFSYLDDKYILVYGSTKHLNVTALNKQEKQIWYKKEEKGKEYEFIFYPQQNIIQINKQITKCSGFLGMCN
ncbi:MAG: hypothetical protein IJ187_10315 [Neisseriaceae bacterium]|nr:hypothetical protein [Neisseriaceae bacterium]